MKILAIGDFQGVFPEKLKQKLKKEEFDLILGLGDYGGIKEWYPYIRDLFKRLKKGDERISPDEFFGEKQVEIFEKKDFNATKKVLSDLNNLKKPIISVFGNTDPEWYTYIGDPHSQRVDKKAKEHIKKLKNFKDITYGKKKLFGINFIGFGGYMDIEAYFKKSTFNAEKEEVEARIEGHNKVKKKFFNFLKKNKDQKGEKIFLFHYPPFGVFDIIKDKENPMDGKSAGVKFYSEAIKKYKPKLVLCGHMDEYQGIKKLYGVPVINPGNAEKGKCAIINLDEKGKINVKFIK
jgi:uncharacterized protein